MLSTAALRRAPPARALLGHFANAAARSRCAPRQGRLPFPTAAIRCAATSGGRNKTHEEEGAKRASRNKATVAFPAALLGATGAVLTAKADKKTQKEKKTPCSSCENAEKLPVENAVITFAPEVPPPITRRHPAHIIVHLDSTAVVRPISDAHKYEIWTYNDDVPGPFIRARVGDVMEVHYENKDKTGVGHNIDFHAVTGPGGGAPALYAEEGQKRCGIFKLLHPGLYVYHCAAAPVPTHVANGMYGLILVEPPEGLPRVDKEYYVMQSEFYGEINEDDRTLIDYSYPNGLDESPMYVVFNGRQGALTEAPLKCKQGERVRLYVGNAGPNLVSSFHVIGGIFDKVYREGDLLSAPARSVQTTLIPSGGSAVVELEPIVPGNLTLVDHSIFRMDKGCIGFLKVLGDDMRTDVYTSTEMLQNCAGCKLHN